MAHSLLTLWRQVSTAADRPAQCTDSCPLCCTQVSTVSVVNWWPRPSPVYHIDRPTKLTAPEMISRSRDIVGTHQNFNGSRDLTTPLSGTVWYPWASTYCSRPIHQIWSLSPPTTKIYLAPPLGVTPLNFFWDFWHQKTRIPGPSYGVICTILRLDSVTDGWTDTRWQHKPC